MVVGRLIFYVLEMGIDANVMSLASFVLPNEIYCLTDDELKRWNIDNSGEISSVWKVEPYKSGMIMASSYNKDNFIKTEMTLFCRKSDERFRMLVTTGELSNDLLKQFRGVNGADIFQFETKLQSSDGNSIPVTLDGYRVGQQRIYATFLLPENLNQLEKRGYFLAPGTPRLYKSAFLAGGSFPSAEFLSLLGRNCI